MEDGKGKFSIKKKQRIKEKNRIKNKMKNRIVDKKWYVISGVAVAAPILPVGSFLFRRGIRCRRQGNAEEDCLPSIGRKGTGIASFGVDRHIYLWFSNRNRSEGNQGTPHVSRPSRSCAER
ncbi:hypothetical protein BJY04DRAFT_187189 [Aspergillus karnatakaensis]|uniref:uncharacterized protein n=1 Tax=Aspergillus karnatakaensis TaxID=1810916 RepID=UPI003CCD6DFD